MRKTFSVELPAEVVDWLESQPDGGADLIEGVAREKMAFSVETPVSPEVEGLLMGVTDPELLGRLRALARYPQLIGAVTSELVTIERAEAMAVEADSRRSFSQRGPEA